MCNLLIKLNTLSDKTKLDKILVTSKDFGHFCQTNNFVYFEIPNMTRFQFYGIQAAFFQG